jgi:hypothetical protein
MFTAQQQQQQQQPPLPQQPSATTTCSQQFGHLAGLSSPEFDSALSDMLMAWYQSGYATGKFYTLLDQQQKAQQQQQAEWWQQSGYWLQEQDGWTSGDTVNHQAQQQKAQEPAVAKK